MAIVATQKIFIDIDDEINFVVEKILAAERDKVILVVPQNALIISSQVSINILAKQILRSKKLLIMVTEDDFGMKLADEAGLVVTQKVSNIAQDMWETAKAMKQRKQDTADRTKTELLARRGIGLEETIVDEELEVEEESPVNAIVGKSLTAPEIETVLTEEEEPGLETAAPETEIEDEAPEVKGPIQRPRAQAKMVKLGNITVFAGGDVDMVESEAVQPNPTMEQNNGRKTLASMQKPKGGFTGKDWTKYTAASSEGNIFSNLMKKVNRKPGRRSPTAASPMTNRRFYMIAGGIGVGAVLLLVYLLMFRLSSVDLAITLKTTEVPVQQSITVDVARKEILNQPLTLPAQLLEDKDLSISATGKADGEGIKGNKAGGLIEIWNKTNKVVTLLDGTVLTEVSGGKKYILTQKVTLAAAKADPGDPNLIIFGGVNNEVRIEAEKVGAEYNLTESNQGLEFKVGDFSTTEVIGKRFLKIEGGTSEKFVAVSEKNFNDSRKKLIEDLTAQGKEKLVALVPDGFRLLEGTEKFERTKSYSEPEVGEEATEFNLTVEGKITALIVSEADLKKAIELLIASSNGGEESFEVSGLEDAVIAEVKRDGNKATFVITSQGSLRSNVTAEEIKTSIGGKSMDEAAAYLSSQEDIEKFTLNFTPGFVPRSMQRVPSDPDRIKVVF